ncbi:MAG: hypothetical protein ACYCW6_15475, partial [Candidatus Xenobia bacterium]
MKPETPATIEGATWAVGDMILDRFEVVDFAVGGMAIVYLTYDTQWQRPFAIKVLRPELASDPLAVERFHREGLVWVQAGRHPFVVQAEMVHHVDG